MIEPPCSRHPRPVRELHVRDHGHDVDLEDLADAVEVGVHERAVDGVDPGVVDQDVQPPERRHRGVHRLGAGLGRPRVPRDGQHPVLRSARGPFHQLLRRGRQLVGLAGGDRHRCSPGEQLGGDGVSDAAAGAGDERRPARKGTREIRHDGDPTAETRSRRPVLWSA